MNDRLEPLILSGLLFDEKYCRKVIPFLNADYFENPVEKIVFGKIDELFNKYNKLPTRDSLLVSINQSTDVHESLYPKLKEFVEGVIASSTDEWLVDSTEQFCKDKALHLAIIQSIEILDGDNKTYTKDALPKLLQDALAVGFDMKVGLSYKESSKELYDFYHSKEKRIPFKLKILNDITGGGIPSKTLSVIIAGTGVGKSLFLCDWAAWLYQNGYNVLYISAEMAQEKIAERIDQNLMNVTREELRQYPENIYLEKKEKLKQNAKGNLVIKEYPTGSCHAGHFRALLAELKIKQAFVPDIILVDYLNICASSRFKMSGTVSSYTYIKAIAEELRGLGVENDVPVFTATQLNREGFGDSDHTMTSTSESFGVPFTADFMISLISTEELERLGQLMLKQQKNRYEDPNTNKRTMIGVNKAKMQLFDLDDTAMLQGSSAVLIANKKIAAKSIEKDFFKPPASSVIQADFSGFKV